MLSNEHPALSLPQEQSLHMPIEDRPGSLCKDRSVPAPARRSSHRILLVDDESEILEGLRTMLEQAGYQLTCTTSLQVALAAITRETFHLVLTDLYLGGDDLGYRLAEAARACKPSVPVILLTGRPSFAGAHEALRSRVAEILVKPVDSSQVLTACRRTIQESELTRRNQELEAQNQVLTAVLPRAIEAKDPTTCGHAERVVHYADMLAQRCGVNREDRDSLRLASLLHDVGKIGVPDGILTKPGPLTQSERALIEQHPQKGYEILEPLSYHENVRTWVYQHHERWDGKGYPNGLAGEEVALPGRILILAEVYDALAEPRSYKAAWELPRIVGYFRDQAGRHFDPDLSHLVANGLERMGGRFFASRADQLF